MKQNGNRILGKVLKVAFPMVTAGFAFKIASTYSNYSAIISGVLLTVIAILSLVQVIKDDE